MEKINFITANQLPKAEGEQVEVLCLEDGQMKRKPADGLGGSTVVIRAKRVFITKDDEFREEITVEPVPAGTFARIKNGMTSGAPVTVIDIVDYTEVNNEGELKGVFQEPAWMTFSDISGTPAGEILGVTEGIDINDGMCYLLPDDRIISRTEMDALMGGDGE